MSKQLSIYVENIPGQLLKITRKLRENKINIKAMCITETKEAGVLRMIIDNPLLGEKILKEEGFSVQVANVLIVKIADQVGAIESFLSVLENQELNIEYMYDLLNNEVGFAKLVLKLDGQIEKQTYSDLWEVEDFKE